MLSLLVLLAASTSGCSLFGQQVKRNASSGLYNTTPISFDILVGGQQSIQWQIDTTTTDPSYPTCPIRHYGKGTQTTSFDNKRPLLNVSVADSQQGTNPLSFHATGNAKLTFTRSAPPEAVQVMGNPTDCELGHCFDPVCLTAPPDCGTLQIDPAFRLILSGQHLTVKSGSGGTAGGAVSNDDWPIRYLNCVAPVAGCLEPVSANLSDAQVRDVKQSAFSVSANVTNPPTTADCQLATEAGAVLNPVTVTWTATFCRRYDFSRVAGQDWQTIAPIVDPILAQSPAFQSALQAIAAAGGTVVRSDTPASDPEGKAIFGETTRVPTSDVASLDTSKVEVRLNWSDVHTVGDLVAAMGHEYGHAQMVFQRGFTPEETAAGLTQEEFTTLALQYELEAFQLEAQVLQDLLKDSHWQSDCARLQILKDSVITALVNGDEQTARELIKQRYLDRIQQDYPNAHQRLDLLDKVGSDKVHAFVSDANAQWTAIQQAWATVP